MAIGHVGSTDVSPRTIAVLFFKFPLFVVKRDRIMHFLEG